MDHREPRRTMLRKKTGPTNVENERGQALVEFAFVAIFLTLVLFGIMDFSRLFFAYATMSQGAREGARYGITHPGPPNDPSDPLNQAIIDIAEARMVVIGGEASVEVLYPDLCNDPMCRLQVRVTADLDMWTPLIPELPVVAQTTMHVE
jgi:hypothetical protein